MRFIDYVEDENGNVQRVQREITWEQIKRLMHEGRKYWRERQERSNSERSVVASTPQTKRDYALSTGDIRRKGS